jgi:mRNA interferase MazF
MPDKSLIDNWNVKKKQLLQRNISFYFYEKEVWWCSSGMNIGFEENGKNENFERPVLILRKFSKELLIVIPMSSINKSSSYYYQIEYGGGNFSVMLSHVRSISSKRLLRKIRKIREEEFVKIKKALWNLLFLAEI